ncbi:MAG: glycosyltransferase [Oscillospiraceae bacterium]|nr:glycosyltransferase [Oscillospiraceae bacterium]
MKYLFINSVAGFGSTGRIAADQCRQLMKEGHQCVLAFGREVENCTDVPTVRIGSGADTKCHALRCRLLDDHGFGSKAATRKFLQWVRSYDPDVIWLHNIHGYYIHIGLLFDYLRICGKEIHWTLHDCWAFTGHCAYFDMAGCEKWKTGCYHCPQKGTYPASYGLDGSRRNYGEKKRLFTGIPNMQLRVPSFWLKKRVEASFLREYPIEVVYNTIDRDIFKPTPGDFRKQHGLEGKIVLLGVASVWDKRKGLDDFLELSQMLPDTYTIVLIGLSEAQKTGLPGNILGLCRTNSLKELVAAYSEADLYLNPSAEETFGMTTLEALCCGTEAVVYQDTACEEIVERFGGVAVPKGAKNLYDAVMKLTKEVQA